MLDSIWFTVWAISTAGVFMSIMAVGVMCGIVVYECPLEEDVLMAAMTLIAVVTS